MKTETLCTTKATVKVEFCQEAEESGDVWYFTRVKGIAGIDIERFGSYQKEVAHRRYLNFISKLENN